MKSTRHAEAFVMDRIMHLLEEGSVTRLVQQDSRFAQYVDEIYTSASQKSHDLRSSASTKK